MSVSSPSSNQLVPIRPARRARVRRPTNDDLHGEIEALKTEVAKLALTTDDAKNALFKLMDDWAKSRVWSVLWYVGALGVASYPQWSPTFWKVMNVLSSGASHG